MRKVDDGEEKKKKKEKKRGKGKKRKELSSRSMLVFAKTAHMTTKKVICRRLH